MALSPHYMTQVKIICSYSIHQLSISASCLPLHLPMRHIVSKATTHQMGKCKCVLFCQDLNRKLINGPCCSLLNFVLTSSRFSSTSDLAKFMSLMVRDIHTLTLLHCMLIFIDIKYSIFKTNTVSRRTTSKQRFTNTRRSYNTRDDVANIRRLR